MSAISLQNGVAGTIRKAAADGSISPAESKQISAELGKLSAGDRSAITKWAASEFPKLAQQLRDLAASAAPAAPSAPEPKPTTPPASPKS